MPLMDGDLNKPSCKSIKESYRLKLNPTQPLAFMYGLMTTSKGPHYISRIIKDGRSFFPCFVIENKLLVNKGSFEKTYPFKGFFFELLNNSLFFKHIEIPTHETEKDRALAVALLQASKTAFLKSFKHGKFIVFLYPGCNEALVPYLKSNGIDYVVGDKNGLTTSDFIPKHEHPNKYANQKVAYALQQYLQR